jgi:hypothetical protein
MSSPKAWFTGVAERRAKRKHWRGYQAQMPPEAAPMLAFTILLREQEFSRYRSGRLEGRS